MRKLSNALPSAKRGERFDAWWARQGSWVEEPNQRRGGVSGVKILQQDDPHQPILYCKRQTGHLYHSLRHPLGRPTILREHQAYQSFLGLGITVPQVVYCAARKQRGQWQALLDLEKSRRRWRVRDAARHDLGQLWRHRGPMREVDWNVLLEAHDRALASASSGA